MTVHLVTFADRSMSRSMEVCARNSQQYGVDNVYRFSPESLAMSYGDTLSFEGRGCGYWQWKPALIALMMKPIPDGDTLIYADAGIEFIGNVNHVISRMDQPIWLFGNNWEHAHWCKGDVMAELGPWGWFGKQAQASVIFFRVSDYSRKFVAEWLDWCLFEGGRLIDDSPSRTPNHPEFREHRHDQAILTTMAYRDGLKLHWWPASYNDGAFTYEKLPQYAADDYPVLFNHHRKRNHEWAKCA